MSSILFEPRKGDRVWRHSKAYFFESMRNAASGAKIKWKQNALRHSFISYRLAEIQFHENTTYDSFVEGFVPGYRCGTVLDSHQIPYFYARFTRRTNSIRERSTCGPQSRTVGARHR